MKAPDLANWFERHSELSERSEERDDAIPASLDEEDYAHVLVNGKRVDTRQYDRWFTRTLDVMPTRKQLQTVYRTGEGRYVVYERTIHQGLSIPEAALKLLSGALQGDENKVGSTLIFRGSATITVAALVLSIVFPGALLLAGPALFLSCLAIGVERSGRSRPRVVDKAIQCFEEEATLQARLSEAGVEDLPNDLRPELYR